MKNKITSKLAARLYNPLLLVNGLNPIPDELGYGQKERYELIYSLYQDAIKETSKKNLVIGLDADYSDVDKGFGGFYSAGYTPPFFSPFGLSKNRWEKDMNFYWPKDHRSDKFMSYLGSINLGIWPEVLHYLTCFDIDSYNKNASFYGGSSFFKYRSRLPYCYNEYYLHFFVSEFADFETSTPDCHVRMTSVEKTHGDIPDWFVKHREKDFENSFDEKETREKIIEWQETKTNKTEIIAPKQFFDNIRPRFYYDGGGYPKQLEDFPRKSKAEVWQYSDADIHLFGPPHSQQEPKRFICPESYYLRALTPIFSFNDSDRDMTYQFYADSLAFDDICHIRAFCKLDGSCT